MVINNERLYAHADGLGNVIALTDQAQVVRRQYGYDDWGNSGGTSGTLALPDADRARWKGALWMGPELDLYCMRNRWYEPGTGRFLSEDPIGLAGGINPVVFAAGNPANGRDPSGLDTKLTDDPRECLALGKSVAFRGGHLVCEDIVQKLPDIGAEAPRVPDDLIDFPDPPCPDCDKQRDPTQRPGGPRPGPGPSCTRLALQTAAGIGLDALGAGLLKRSKTAFENGARWFTLARNATSRNASFRRALGRGEFAESRHFAGLSGQVNSAGAIFGAVTIGDVKDAAVFLAGFIPGYGAGITAIVGIGEVVACYANQGS